MAARAFIRAESLWGARGSQRVEKGTSPVLLGSATSIGTPFILDALFR
jgi:hypothetical protein